MNDRMPTHDAAARRVFALLYGDIVPWENESPGKHDRCRSLVAAALGGAADEVVVPRAELDDLFHDRGATDLPGIRAALGETR